MKWKKYRHILLFTYCLLILWFIFPSGFSLEETGEDDETVESVNSDQIQEKPKIALTFDDGPNTKYTPVLLEGLKERNVKATFFLIGENAEKPENREIIERMYQEGHLIGNHTYSHVEIAKVDNDTAIEELKKTNQIIREITGEEVLFMRPPFGEWQKELEREIDLIPVMWSVDPLDWTTANVDEVVNKVIAEVEEDDIILLHDCYESSVQAALRIVDLLLAEGYEFVTVDELLLQ